MTYLAFTGLAIFLASFPLGLFIVHRNSKSSVTKAYLNLNLSVALYGISYFFWQISTNITSQIFWFKILGIGIILIEPAFLHFTFSLTEQIRKKKNFLIGCYVINIIFIYFNLSGMLYTRFIPKYNFGLWPIPTTLFSIYLSWWFFQVLYGFIYLLKGLENISGSRHNQIKYVAIAGVVGFAGAVTNWPLWYNINFPPYLNILIAVHIAFIAYAIFRHRMLDIEVIIKKSLVFAGTFIFAFGVFVGVTLAVSQLIGGGRILSLAISSVIIVIGLKPIETWLVNATDRFLFQKRYEYKEIIKAFIGEVITKLNLDDVINSTLRILDETIHPYASGIFILNKVDDKYQLYNAMGLGDKNLSFTSESKLVTYLKRSKSPAIIRQIDGIVGVNPEIASEMAVLKAVLVLPLLLHDDLIGFISLGGKKSDEAYSKDDLEVLQDLARTESVAVGNAQLLTEAAQAERRAAIGTMSAGINHEIGNPLNIMSTKIQMFKLSRQKGMFKDKPVEETLDHAEAALDECLKQSGRISEITKKLSNFAKPSKEFKPQLINIADEIEETLAMVGHDLELEKIKIEKKIPSDLYKILADRREIQQVFFNIIRNAAQAIEEAGKITITAANNTNKLHIEIQDTGKGIPEDKIHRIFEPFFTTKVPNQGTGLGLSIVRQLVWKNKGEISFRSQSGVGTIFILEFPKGE